ncbi:hypothetical protein QUB63_10495 [Microcoleus sp. ARI1-B5]|uniref:hypothetical protein n=1 Tax=unclassified Microcoleus TaxID=2642155 RepID=UPI002FCF3BEB
MNLGARRRGESKREQVLDNFIEQCLPTFRPYQDAMVRGEETIWHCLISPYLNIGLLHPLEVIQAGETAYFDKNLNLTGVEGFIRQIIGWREYIRSVYFYINKMSDYFGGCKFDRTVGATMPVRSISSTRTSGRATGTSFSRSIP